MLLKFVSINVWEGGKLMDQLLPWLREQAPDLLFVQEAYNSSDPKLEPRLRTVEVLSKELGLKHNDFAPTFRVMWEGGDDLGTAVFSKFPISSSKQIFFVDEYREVNVDEPKEWQVLPRSLQHVLLSTTAGELNALNVHGPWYLDGDAVTPEREAMAEAIIRAAKGKQRVIVAGDSNARTRNPVFEKVDKQLVSVFGQELATTFNVRRKNLDNFPGYASAPVDLMYVTPDVRVVKHACPDVDVSDHLPLVATLEI